MSTDAQRLSSQNPSALPVGTRLGEFEVRGLLGTGGFGIVYLAFDHALEREVAVKEYMPAALAGRTETMHVSIRSQSDAESFELGLKSFVNEARLLARFNDPALLKVHRFWEANGTAYMAMPVLKGRTLKEVRPEMTRQPDEAWLRALLTPLLGAIEKLHGEGVYHRDIAPDNIQIEPDGHPVLLDFGAARRVISDKSQALTAILKPAYAPIEQYGELGAVKQGPWTDLYALGATLHYLLLQRPPPPATARMVADELSALTPEACPGCSENFLALVDWMLAPRPADRPQSVAAVRAVLDGHALPPLRKAAPPAFDDSERTIIVPPPASARAAGQPPAPTPQSSAPAGYDDSGEAATIRVQRPLTDSGRSAPAAAPTQPRRDVQPKSKLPFMLGGGVAVVVAIAVAVGVGRKPAPAVVAEAPVASAPEAASAVSPTLSQVPEAAAAAAPAVAVASAPAAEAASPAPVSTAPGTGAAPSAPAAPTSVAQTSGAQRPAVSAVPAVPAVAAARPAVVTPPPNPAETPAKPRPQAPATVAKNPAPQTGGSSYGSYGEPANAQPAQPVAPPEAQRRPADTPTQPVISTPAKPTATNPEAVCAGRGALSYFVCMDKECRKSEQIETADCRKWHHRRNPNE